MDLDNIPTRMSVLMIHFTSTSRIKEKMCSVWATSRLVFNKDFNMVMNHTDYNFYADNILLNKKHLQLPFTKKIFYLQFFLTNYTDLVQNLIQ